MKRFLIFFSFLFVGQHPLAKNWNKGFNAGKFGFIAQQTFKDTCKRKK